jgi:thymidylate kinase
VHPIIAITGPDRVGKATQAQLLSEDLKATLVSFPDYKTLTGQLIRACLTNSELLLCRELSDKTIPRVLEYTETRETWTKRSEHFQALNFIARVEKQDYIREALKSGPIVGDRYISDALVYGKVDGCNLEWVRALQKPLIPEDLTIVLMGPQFPREEIADVNETNLLFRQNIIRTYEELTLVEPNWYMIHTVIPSTHPTSILDWTEKQKQESILLTYEKIRECVLSVLEDRVHFSSISTDQEIIHS